MEERSDEMRFGLPQTVNYIIDSLAARGYRADIVGGSVRDLLLGKAPDDYDITTDAQPKEIKSVFASDRTVDTGIKHGTVSIILDGRPYEVTTYRVDGEYKDSRHPETVSFTRNIEEDLARRDFTINAMAYSPDLGITDPFGGRTDLKNGIIRAVGDPDMRFSEDALRILRGIRFSAALGFEIEKNTLSALRRKKQLLKNVSAERIYIELRKTISAPNAYFVLRNYSDVIFETVPELLRLRLPDESLFRSADYTSRLLSLFFLSSSDPTSDFDAACRRLRTDSHIRELGASLLSSVGRYDLGRDVELTYALRDLGEESTRALVRLEILLGRAEEGVTSSLERLLSSGVCYRLCDLAVNGRDVASLGVSGPEIGVILNRLLTLIIDGRAVNERETLLALAEDMAKQIL